MNCSVYVAPGTELEATPEALNIRVRIYSPQEPISSAGITLRKIRIVVCDIVWRTPLSRLLLLHPRVASWYSTVPPTITLYYCFVNITGGAHSSPLSPEAYRLPNLNSING